MIIGLSGLKGSGKDTVGAYLVKQYAFQRLSFADKLKQSAAALFGVEPSELEKMKNDPTVQVVIGRYTDTREAYYSFNDAMSVREMLQRYGTEAHRDVFGENFWVDQLLPVEGYYAGRAIVVTDVRFKNELRRITEIGGFTVFVNRPALDLKDPHRSEQEVLDYLEDERFDHVLMNDDTIDYLYGQVDQMLVRLGDREVFKR